MRVAILHACACAFACPCLQRKEVDALVLDSYILELAAATRCDLMVVGGEWKQVRGMRWRWGRHSH